MSQPPSDQLLMPCQAPAPHAGHLTLISKPSPFDPTPEIRMLPQGKTVRDLVMAVDPIAARHEAAMVMLRRPDGGEDVIPPMFWDRVRIRAGHVVTIVPVPRGGDGDKTGLKVALTIAVIVASFYAPYLVPEFVAGMTILGGPTVAVALQTGVALLGTMAINALFPPVVPKIGSQSDIDTSYAITGTRNAFNPRGVVPRILGRVRIFPPLWAKPFTEASGEVQRFNMLCCLGQGPLMIEPWKIGDTALSEYTQAHLDYLDPNGDSSGRIFAWDEIPVEDAIGAVVSKSGGRVVRTSAANASRITLDLAFLRGLFKIKDGKRKPWGADFEVFISPEGLDQWESVGTLRASANSGLGWRKPFEIPNLAGIKYDIGIDRLSDDNDDDDNIQDQATWGVLRTFVDRSPVTDWSLVYPALRILATDQLNGPVQELNCVATSIVPDYDVDSDSWITRATDNPASLFRAVLQDDCQADPATDAEIDLAALEIWHGLCETNGWKYGRTLAEEISTFDVLRELCAVGRAAPINPDGKWSVIVDVPQSVPVQMFSPRNSWGFKAEKLFHELPQVYQVDFKNAENDFLPDDMEIYVDGYTAETATRRPAAIKFPGDNIPDQIWKAVHYLHAAAKLRPENMTLFSHAEHLVCTKGSLVQVGHDVMLWGLLPARIKAVAQSGDSVTGLTLEAPVPFEAGKTYAIRIRSVKGGVNAFDIDNPGTETATITFATPINVAPSNVFPPLSGDLTHVGERTMETVACLVKEIYPAQDGTARLSLVEAAPDIHTADQGTIPTHNPKTTQALSLVPPPVPVIEDVRSDETVMVRHPDGSLGHRINVDFSFASGVQASLLEVEGQIRRSSESTTLPGLGDGLADDPLFTAPPLGVPKAILFDLPMLKDADVEYAPRFVGQTRPWPDKMNCWLSVDGGSTYALSTAAGRQGAIGTTSTVLASGFTSRFDESQSLDVHLESGSLSSSTDLLVGAGSNRAALETASGAFEVIAFVNAQDLGDGNWRLSRLLRGLQGSDEEMVTSLATGARFILLDSAVRQAGFATSDIGVARDWKYGPDSRAESDVFHGTETATFNALGRRPYSPCQGSLVKSGNDRVFSWLRRDRIGGDTWDGEIPLSETSELYDLEILSGGSPVRTLTDLTAASYTYLEADQITDFGSVQATIAVRIYQKSSTYTPNSGRGGTYAPTLIAA